MQNHDKLLCREEKREMIRLRVDQVTGSHSLESAGALLAGTREGPSGAPFGQAMTRRTTRHTGPHLTSSRRNDV
jgi:hypothetical protein